MRLIGKIDEPQLAERFSAFLLTQGIATRIDAVSGPKQGEAEPARTHEIWVKEEDQFDQAKAELHSFLETPDDAKYSSAVRQAEQIAREQEKKRRQIKKNIQHVGAGGLRKRPTITLLLIAISVLVALMTDFGKGWQTDPVFHALAFLAVPPPASEQIVLENNFNMDALAVRLASIYRGEIWRLFSSMFLHHGTVHILFNMIWLYQLGKLIENRYGWKQYLVLILLASAIPNLVQGIVPGRLDGSVPGLNENHVLLSGTAGMSGVVYGLFGFVWMRSLYDPTAGFYLPQSTIVIMLGWLLFCMVPGLTENLIGASVANWAHGVGLLVGMALGYLPVLKKR